MRGIGAWGAAQRKLGASEWLCKHSLMRLVVGFQELKIKYTLGISSGIKTYIRNKPKKMGA
jgi:hypothetical protein